MILIDSRVGSRELLPDILKLVHAGTEVKLSKTLPGGDFVFEGNLPEGRGLIAIERKTVGDLISSMTTNRTADNQLPELQKFSRAFLLVEGFYAPEQDGRLKCYGHNRNMMYSSVDNWINSMALNFGLRTMRSGSRFESACKIVNLYNLLQKKKHWANAGYYDPMVYTSKPTLKYKWLNAIDGIGNTRLSAHIRKFKSAEDIAKATISDWEEVTGSTKIAVKIYKQIRERR